MTGHLCHSLVFWIQKLWKRINHKCLNQEGHGTHKTGMKSSMKCKMTDIPLSVCDPASNESKAKDKQMEHTSCPEGAQSGLRSKDVNFKARFTFSKCYGLELKKKSFFSFFKSATWLQIPMDEGMKLKTTMVKHMNYSKLQEI